MKPVNGGAVSNTVIEYELADGTVVPLTFTWGHMVHVQATEKGVYKRFSRALMAGEIQSNILNVVLALYVAYLCGYIQQNGTISGSMSEKEFMELVPNDLGSACGIIGEIFLPKAKAASEGRS